MIGLTNTVRDAQHVIHVRFNNTMRRPAKASSATSCETPYPTTQQLFDNVVNGSRFPVGYGAGPGCSGLTPSQDNSIYGAPNVGPRGKGKGVDIAVFELSAYLHSDIATWAHQFYGPRYNPPLVDVNVDGGPLNPQCPAGDTCPPEFNGYSGDIEVDADIQTQLAIAPDVSHLIVYNAPNDFTGQTSLDEWSAIAKANVADSVSSSWAVCENDVTAAYAQAENTIFEQMAAQGQSMFGAAGDTGAFACIRSDGTTIVNVLDPPSQPWVTSVGGTSFENFNPGTNPHPRYPARGEAVWNVAEPVQQRRAQPGQRQPGRLLLVRRPPAPAAAGPASAGACRPTRGARGHQRQHHRRQRHDPVRAGQDGYAVPRGARHLRQRRRVHAVRRVLHRQARTRRPASARRSAAASPSPAGSGSAGPACPRRCVSAIIADRDSFQGHRSGNINPTLYRLYQIAPQSSSTTSPAPATSPRTTACSRRCAAMTSPPESARSGWPP